MSYKNVSYGYRYNVQIKDCRQAAPSGVERDATFALRLMRSYARNQGGQVSVSVIHTDLISNNVSPMSE